MPAKDILQEYVRPREQTLAAYEQRWEQHFQTLMDLEQCYIGV